MADVVYYIVVLRDDLHRTIAILAAGIGSLIFQPTLYLASNIRVYGSFGGVLRMVCFVYLHVNNARVYVMANETGMTSIGPPRCQLS